jgi:type I restriction enzyme R subunit
MALPFTGPDPSPHPSPHKASKDPNYCQRVTANDGEIGEQHLRDFQDNEKTIPTILTTSQKLSTGVDARNIRNIVLKGSAL